MQYVYFLKSRATLKVYVGSTDDLKRRLAEHNRAKVTSTKAFVPWDLIYYEAHLSKTLAKRAEIFYKSSQGRRQVKKKLGLE